MQDHRDMGNPWEVVGSPLKVGCGLSAAHHWHGDRDQSDVYDEKLER
jgi:hypothetical protein